MYNFIDVNGVSAGNTLPAEALKINGAYIENKITGYRTLTVSGREALSPELTTYETGARDGSTLQSKRFPARVITVRFQLIAASEAAYRATFNQLGEILNVENAELIFADELDKYFTGTPSGISDIEPGSNAVTGEFTLYCADPLKYSVAERVVNVPTGQKNVSFTYNGTYRTYPKLEAAFYEESEPAALTGNGDCGFVSFFDANNHIIQLGNPDEVDLEVQPAKSEALLNQIFKASDAWDSAARALWSINNTAFEAQQIGTLGMAQLNDGVNYYLKATNYGSVAESWISHGASMTRTIPGDSSGGTTNNLFDMRFKPVFCTNDVNAVGDWALIMLTADGTKYIKVRLVKNTVGKTGTMEFYANDQKVYSGSFDVSIGNAQFGAGLSNPNCHVYKTSSGFTFEIGGVTKSIQIASVPTITKFAFMYAQYGARPAVTYNGLLWCQFIKNFEQKWIDIPNKFGSNDVCVANCKDGTITLNNTPTPELGALGNDWEQFCLTPGLNQIGVAYSDWVASAPVFKIRYREAYL